MNPVANPPLITALPPDVLNEIVIRLPVVKSKAPWRDLNSLAYSCRFMSQWRANGVKPLIKQAWCQVAKTLTETKDWRSALLKVVDQSSDPWTRLFREPVLRKLASTRQDIEDGDVSRTYPGFIATVSSHRESLSVAEFRHFLDVCGKSSPSQKDAILATMPRLLEGFTADDLLQACAILSKSLGKDRELCRRLAKLGVMEKLLDAAGRSKQGFAMLELSLLARDSLPYPMSELDVKQTLSVIPDKKRWSWVSRSVREFIQSGTIVRCLLSDRYCSRQLVKFMCAALSEEHGYSKKIDACGCVYEGRSILATTEEGRALLDLVSDWIVNCSLLKIDGEGALKNRFVSLIGKFSIPLCIFAPKGTSGTLAKQMRLATEYAVAAGKLNDASSILRGICWSMRVPLPSRIRGDEGRLGVVFVRAIRKAAELTDWYSWDCCCTNLIFLAKNSRLGNENIRLLKLEVKHSLRARQNSMKTAHHVHDYDAASES